eukprot:TRINITY_DN16979_c0_g1_i1.p1 TRINITY_DN16979_c0_g1~~TRINITY_DN16979_c0_g1_i1.p1  ORF type:complete len:191 (-),score=26.30 TRINITY_DN16979_c0_g1_i1:21-593(-)
MKAFRQIDRLVSLRSTVTHPSFGRSFVTKGFRKTFEIPALGSLSSQSRCFGTDDSGFHDDFKAIKTKYQGQSIKSDEGDVQEFIKKEIESHPVVVFMKGVPAAPQCGFSRLVIRLLEEEGVTNIRGINVLADNAVREGIKQYTKWPTIPQVFINKEFIGGSDIVRSMFESRELTKKLEDAGVKLTPPKSE